MTQKAIAQLYNVDRSVVTKHLKNAFESGKLVEHAVCAKFAHTADDGKTYQNKFYSLSCYIKIEQEDVSVDALIRDETIWLKYDNNDNDGYPFINGNNLIDGRVATTPATKMVPVETYTKNFIDISSNAILILIKGPFVRFAMYSKYFHKLSHIAFFKSRIEL